MAGTLEGRAPSRPCLFEATTAPCFCVRPHSDLRLLDAAIAQYAIDTNKTTGMAVTMADLQPYLKKGGALYNTGQDILGNDFGQFAVDSLPLVPTATWRALSDVADQAFWSPYYQERAIARPTSAPERVKASLITQACSRL